MVIDVFFLSLIEYSQAYSVHIYAISERKNTQETMCKNTCEFLRHLHVHLNVVYLGCLSSDFVDHGIK